MAVFLAVARPNRAQIINGDFESGLTGWTPALYGGAWTTAPFPGTYVSAPINATELAHVRPDVHPPGPKRERRHDIGTGPQSNADLLRSA